MNKDHNNRKAMLGFVMVLYGITVIIGFTQAAHNTAWAGVILLAFGSFAMAGHCIASWSDRVVLREGSAATTAAFG